MPLAPLFSVMLNVQVQVCTALAQPAVEIGAPLQATEFDSA